MRFQSVPGLAVALLTLAPCAAMANVYLVSKTLVPAQQHYYYCWRYNEETVVCPDKANQYMDTVFFHNVHDKAKYCAVAAKYEYNLFTSKWHVKLSGATIPCHIREVNGNTFHVDSY